MKIRKCPLCFCNNLHEVYHKSDVCTSIGILSREKNERRQRSSINLVQCNECGFVFNTDFDLEKINSEYKSQDYVLKKIVSYKMNANLKNIHNYLLQFLTKQDSYLEIGSGDGALALEIAPYVNHVYTVDPSVESIKVSSVKNVTHIKDFFSCNILKLILHRPKLVCMRHLLEHISNPFEFLTQIVEFLNTESFLYIEVPNAEEIFFHHRFYDIFNDHFAYFTKGTLVNVLHRLGLQLINDNYMFNGQHMGLTFKKTENISGGNIKLAMFDKNVAINFENAIANVNDMINMRQNVIIYGAGAHGNSILDYIHDKSKIQGCIDMDISKQGKFLQCSDIEIKQPNFDNLKNIDAVLIASALYEDEICEMLKRIGYTGCIIKTACCL